MFEVKCNRIPLKDSHHDFIYSEGLKIPKVDNGLRYTYIDKTGMLKVTKYEDKASFYGGGVYAITTKEEVDSIGGKPLVRGSVYEIFGIFEDNTGVGVYSVNQEKHYCKMNNDKTFIKYPNANQDDYTYLYACMYALIHGGTRVYA